MMNNTLILASFLIEAVFWIGAYLLILRNSFKHKIHYMPVAAMCGNIAWEFLIGLDVFPACPAYWPACPETIMQPATLFAALLDAVILYTILRFGREQFRWPEVRKYFPAMVFGGVALAAAIIYAMMSELYTVNVYQAAVGGVVPEFILSGLDGGLYTGWGLALMMGILFIAQFVVRGDLRGQSIWVALFMFLGNLGAYLFDFFATGNRLLPLLHILALPSLAINLLYVWLLRVRAKDLGVNPWRS